MPALGNALGLPYRKNGLGFVGALDAYLTNLIAVYSINDKLVASYNGSAVRVRRSSDNTLTDIGFLGNGDFDAASYLAFIGAGNGFAHTVYDQSGNSRHQVQATAAAQPQIGVDGNGNYYLYAPVQASPPRACNAPDCRLPARTLRFGRWQAQPRMRSAQ